MAHPENTLIQQLPRAAQRQLLKRCEPFELQLSAELSEHGQPLSHAHFPREGFISLVVDIESHPALEVGMVGPESMLGSELLLGLAKTPWRALVQGAGSSWRIAAQDLRDESDASPDLRRLLQRCVLLRLHQQTLASVCERFHTIGPRVARWLLMSLDRSGSDSFYLTQAFLSMMLGVRRVGITVAAGEFQQQGLIRYHRGRITVLDRVALEAQACSCYAADKRLYQELMPLHP